MKFLMEDLPIKKDNHGNKLTNQQIKFFERSNVKYNNKLLVCYHGSTNKFNIFKTGDIGFHFGNLNQANARKNVKNSNSWYIFKVYLNIENYFEFNQDLLFWDPQTIAIYLLFGNIDNKLDYYKSNINNPNILNINKIFKGEEYLLKEIVLNYKSNESDIYNNEYSKNLRSLFKKLNYDGIKYPNEFESEGDSFIIFDQNQVKSISNKYPTKSNDIDK